MALIAAAVAVIMLKKPSPPVENTTTVANLQTENLWGWNNANNSIINILY